MEDEEWNWDNPMMINLNFPTPSLEIWQNELVDDVPVRGTRLLSDIYDRCNIVVCEHANYEEAKKNQIWVVAVNQVLWLKKILIILTWSRRRVQRILLIMKLP